MKVRGSRAARPAKGWAIVDYTGTVYPFSVRLDRRTTIRDYEHVRGSIWASLKAKGFRAIKVRIVPEPPP